MQIGACKLFLRLPENDNLKGKRSLVRSMEGRIKSRFNVAVAEVSDNDSWQQVTLGIACVSNDARHANEVLSNVVKFISLGHWDAELLDYEIEILPVLS
jgi:uncharacterized protein YlxP (DUF503 family)